MKMEDCFMVDDEFLNFTLEEEGEEEEEKSTISTSKDRSSSSSLEDHSRSFSESVEEELEWLSNKDAFPAVEFDIFSDNPNILFDHHSPVSVLGNNSSSGSNGNGNESTIMSCCGSLQVPINYPVRPRSKRRRRKRRTGFPDLPSQHCHRRIQVNSKNDKQEKALVSLPMTNAKSASSIGRRCQHCGVDNTPQWRAGPMGPKTLCNACGVRYKSGRLLPEYRPANSPTYSAAVHSNSHRKVLEMRKQKMGVGGVMIHEGCRYRVG